MNSKKIMSVSTGLALAAAMAMAIPAFAQTNEGRQNNDQQGQQNQAGRPWGGPMMGAPGFTGTNPGADAKRGSGIPGTPTAMIKPGVFGTVTAVNGNIITINARRGFGSTTATSTYTVDATNATIRKGNATSTVSSIAVGDMIAAQGTITGSNVVATAIFDGIKGPMMNNRGEGQENKDGRATSTPPFVGNGQPIIIGTISAINGTSLTVTTASNTTYTVDASNAKIVEGQNTAITLSKVVVGNKVLVQGTVNGTSITASTVIDQSVGKGTPATEGKEQPRGFFGGVGSFFAHLFGF